MPTSRAMTGPTVGRGIMPGPYYGNHHYSGNAMMPYNCNYGNGYGAYGMYGTGMGAAGHSAYSNMYGRPGQAYGTNPHRGYGPRGPSWLRNQSRWPSMGYAGGMYGGAGNGHAAMTMNGYTGACGNAHSSAYGTYNPIYRQYDGRTSYPRRQYRQPTPRHATYYHDDYDDYDYDSGFDSSGEDFYDEYRPLRRRRSNSRALVRYGGQRRRYSTPLVTSPRGAARRRALLTPRRALDDDDDDSSWERYLDDEDLDDLEDELECLSLRNRRRPTTGFEEFWEDEWDRDRDGDRRRRRY